MLLRQEPLQQSDPCMHGAPGAPASQDPPPPARQTLFPVSQLLLQQSEFILQLPPTPAQFPPELPPPLEDVIVHMVDCDT